MKFELGTTYYIETDYCETRVSEYENELITQYEFGSSTHEFTPMNTEDLEFMEAFEIGDTYSINETKLVEISGDCNFTEYECNESIKEHLRTGSITLDFQRINTSVSTENKFEKI